MSEDPDLAHIREAHACCPDCHHTWGAHGLGGWTPNFDYQPGDRIKAGRPRFRRSRRVLAGWLERVAGEIQR